MERPCSASLLVVVGPLVRSVPGEARKRTYSFGKCEGKESRKPHDHSHNPQPVGSPDGEAAICKGSIDVHRINHWVFGIGSECESATGKCFVRLYICQGGVMCWLRRG